MNKNLEELKNDLKSYRSCIKLYQSDGYDISYDIEDFIQHSINLFEDFEKRIIKLEKKEESFGPKIRLIKEVPKRKPKTVQKIKVGGTDPD